MQAFPYRQIITIILALFSLSIYAHQPQGQADTTLSKLCRTWFLDWSESKDSLSFSSTRPESYGWGSRIEIHDNGDFVDAYSARCGNDGKIHHNAGTWTLDIQTMILRTSIPIDYRGTSYRIAKLDTNQLILIEVITE